MPTEREQLAFLLGLTLAASEAHNDDLHGFEHRLLDATQAVNGRTRLMSDPKVVDALADELAIALPELWEKDA